MFRRGRSRKFWWGCSIYPVFIVMGRAYSVLLYASLSRHIIALSFVVFEELTVRLFCLGDPGWLVTYVFLMVAHSGFFKELVFIVVVVVVFFFILLQVLRYTHAVPFQWHLFNEASLGQNTNQLYPTIFSFPLASILRTSIALHCL